MNTRGLVLLTHQWGHLSCSILIYATEIYDVMLIKLLRYNTTIEFAAVCGGRNSDKLTVFNCDLSLVSCDSKNHIITNMNMSY